MDPIYDNRPAFPLPEAMMSESSSEENIPETAQVQVQVQVQCFSTCTFDACSLDALNCCSLQTGDQLPEEMMSESLSEENIPETTQVQVQAQVHHPPSHQPYPCARAASQPAMRAAQSPQVAGPRAASSAAEIQEAAARPAAQPAAHRQREQEGEFIRDRKEALAYYRRRVSNRAKRGEDPTHKTNKIFSLGQQYNESSLVQMV